jgi:predicted TIM-barrel fold metal-dependent hydrolase
LAQPTDEQHFRDQGARHLVEPRLANAMAHSWNLTILRQMKQHPRELIGGAMVALQDVPGAIREMEWARENGFRAVILDKVFPVQEHCYSDPYGSHRELWPFFARAEALGMPLFLHNIQHGHRITNLLNGQQRTRLTSGQGIWTLQAGGIRLASGFSADLSGDELEVTSPADVGQRVLTYRRAR